MARLVTCMDTFTKTESWKFVGRGGYGQVYSDNWVDANGKQRLIAFKQSNPNMSPEEMSIISEKEIESLSKLNHLFVVKYLGLVEMAEDENPSGRPVILMELCEGSLKDYILDKLPTLGTLNERIILGQAVLGLAYIHSKGIIHKDLKPANILLWKSQSGIVLAKLADFGYSKGLRKDQEEFTPTNHYGTEGYMAPELLVARDSGEKARASYASDAYALGITVSFTMNKGKHPFGEKKYERNYLMYKGTAPTELDGDWDLTDIVARLTHKDPKKRPQVDTVIHHPFFVLSNDKTKMSFVDKLYNFFESFASWTYETETLEGDDDDKLKLWWFLSGDYYNHERLAGIQFEIETNEGDSSVSSVSLPIEISFSSANSSVSSTRRSSGMSKEEEAGSKPSSFDRKIKTHLFNAEVNIMEKIKKTNNFTRSHIYSLMLENPKFFNFYVWCLMYDLHTTLLAIGITNNHYKKCFEMTEFEFFNSLYDDPEVVKEIWDLKYGEGGDAEDDIQLLFAYTASQHFPPYMWEVLIKRFSNMMNSTENGIKGRPLLNWAASNESPSASPEKFIRSILAHGGDPNGMDIFGLTPVHMAARNMGPNASGILRTLLENNGDPNKPNQRIEDHMMDFIASVINLEDFKELFLQKMVSGMNSPRQPTSQDDVFSKGYPSSPLWSLYFDKEGIPTAKFCELMKQLKVPILLHPTVLEGLASFLMGKLTRNSGYPDIQNLENRTPLHCVASNESALAPKLMEILLSFGGDPALKDDRGLTPLDCAAINSSISGAEMVRILGGNPTVINAKKNTPADLSSHFS